MTDTGYTSERWAFDEEVTRVFDDMLGRSIPAYLTMRDLTTRLAQSFITPGTCVADLGTSRGEAIASLHPEGWPAVSFIGLEVSTPMRDAAALRFADASNVSIFDVDLRDRGATQAALRSAALPCSVVLAILTVQFVPIEHRAGIIADAFDALDSGGAFLLVEKVLGATGRTSQLLVDVYHEGKLRAGYTTEAVERKRLALEGVLVPQTARANEMMLLDAGFRTVECYWRWANFAGWVAIKP